MPSATRLYNRTKSECFMKENLAFAMFVECTYTQPIRSEAKPAQIKKA